MSTSAILLLFLLLLFHHPLLSSSWSSSPTSSSSSSTAAAAASSTPPSFLFLPLKSQELITTNSTTNKLYFHRNVSLLVSLSLGSPPQNVTMVLDTGSELSWLLCSNSINTTTSQLYFYPQLSSTYAPIPCTSPTCTTKTRDLPSPASCSSPNQTCLVSVSYADGSFSDGSLSSDTFRFGASLPFPAAFGCMTSSYSSTPTSTATSGLLGMNRGSLSLVSQMGAPRFSYCIPSSSSFSGVLLLGEPPFPLHLNYTPLVQTSLPLPYFDRVAYSVQLLGIRVADSLLEIPKSVLVPDHTGAGQTMVDSGTQFTFLLGPAYEALKLEFLRRTVGFLDREPGFVYEGAFDVCYRVGVGEASVKVGALPAVTLVLEGAEVRVEGERLLYRVVDGGEGTTGGDGIWCLTFGNSDLVPLEAYIIGHHHQQDLWVEYDLRMGRVGFATVRCDLASQRLSALSS